jgi:hypothetical protein
VNTRTLRPCPPNLRTETLRSFETRLKRHATEASDCADIAQQLDLVPLAVDLRDVEKRIDAARLTVAGCAR